MAGPSGSELWAEGPGAAQSRESGRAEEGVPSAVTQGRVGLRLVDSERGGRDTLEGRWVARLCGQESGEPRPRVGRGHGTEHAESVEFVLGFGELEPVTA